MIFQYIDVSKPPKMWYLMALKVITVAFVILIIMYTKKRQVRYLFEESYCSSKQVMHLLSTTESGA